MLTCSPEYTQHTQKKIGKRGMTQPKTCWNRIFITKKQDIHKTITELTGQKSCPSIRCIKSNEESLILKKKDNYFRDETKIWESTPTIKEDTSQHAKISKGQNYSNLKWNSHWPKWKGTNQ